MTPIKINKNNISLVKIGDILAIDESMHPAVTEPAKKDDRKSLFINTLPHNHINKIPLKISIYEKIFT